VSGGIRQQGPDRAVVFIGVDFHEMTDMEARRWHAVRLRDNSAVFIFGVQTTRIACRPGCPSRTPRPENVRFFEDFAAARAAGFRACKRCAPDDVAANADRQRLVTRACALMDADEALSFEAVSRSIGLKADSIFSVSFARC